MYATTDDVLRFIAARNLDVKEQEAARALAKQKDTIAGQQRRGK